MRALASSDRAVHMHEKAQLHPGQLTYQLPDEGTTNYGVCLLPGFCFSLLTLIQPMAVSVHQSTISMTASKQHHIDAKYCVGNYHPSIPLSLPPFLPPIYVLPI